VADISILNPATGSGSSDYKIAGALEIIIRSVTASFDGTAAGQSYVPAVQVLDPSGFIVGTFPAGSTLAAGASADATWFPGVTPPVTSHGTTPVALVDYVQITASVNVTSTNKNAPTTVLTGNAITYDGVTSITATFFSPIIEITTPGFMRLVLWQDATAVGVFGHLGIGAAGPDTAIPGAMSVHYTPTAGTHTLSVRGYLSSGTTPAAATVFAGSVGFQPDQVLPAFLEVVTP